MPPGEGSRSDSEGTRSGRETLRTGPADETESDWSDTLAYGGDTETAVPGRDVDSDHWSRWHYGIYLGTAMLLVGAYRGALALLLAGYLLVPVTTYLDSRYLDSVTTGWQPDVGLYLVGSLLFPFLMVPIYLYRRWELRSAK